MKLLFRVLLAAQIPLSAACPVGALTQVMLSPFATGSRPLSVAFSPEISGSLFSAVANFGTNTVSVYSVNVNTGAFTPVVGSPFLAGNHPASVAFSQLVSGHLFAATANRGDNTVSVYSVNTSTGVFSAVAGSPFGTGQEPLSVAFSPVISGNLFAAVANNIDNTVSVYSVNTTTGVFSPIDTLATGDSPQAVAFSPVVSGNLFAAATNADDNTLSVYSVNTNTGIFSPIGTFATGDAPHIVAFSPEVSGNLFAAVTNSADNDVSVYNVNINTGHFTPVSNSPFATGALPETVAFSPEISGTLFAAVTNFTDNTVSLYSVDISTGHFTPVANSPFATGTGPQSVVFTSEVSDNLFVAVTNFLDNTVSIYSVDISIPTIQTLTADESQVCIGNSTTLRATISGGTAPYSVTWSDGFVQTGVSSFVTRTVSPLSTTTYSIISVTDANGCMSPSYGVSVTLISSLSCAIRAKYCPCS